MFGIKRFTENVLASQTEATFMTTECKQSTLEFHGLLHRKVKARFDGGKITSNAGVLLLREVERRTGLIAGMTKCFTDHRDQRLIEHTVKELLGQRIYGLCLGYEDHDHDQLRTETWIKPTRDGGRPTSVRNRLELTGDQGTRRSPFKIDRWMVDAARLRTRGDCAGPGRHRRHDPWPSGRRFYHGYYGNYCYLPLYIFSGEHLLCARLRRSDIDGADGAVDELNRIVGQIRQSWRGCRSSSGPTSCSAGVRTITSTT